MKKYDNSQLLYVYDEPPQNTVEMSESTVAAVTKGMHELTTTSLAGAFANCVVSAGAKTGSAQVGTEIANGVFVAYAPYEDPEIAVAIVIEKAVPVRRWLPPPWRSSTPISPTASTAATWWGKIRC